MLARIFTAALLAGLLGCATGFVAAAVTLQARHWRNDRLMARGEPGIRDCVFPTVFVKLSGLLALVLGAVLAPFVAWWLAIAIAAAAPMVALIALAIGLAIANS